MCQELIADIHKVWFEVINILYIIFMFRLSDLSICPAGCLNWPFFVILRVLYWFDRGVLWFLWNIAWCILLENCINIKIIFWDIYVFLHFKMYPFEDGILGLHFMHSCGLTWYLPCYWDWGYFVKFLVVFGF